MSAARWLSVSERWLRLLLRLYPADFREEMGEALVETYRDRCRAALSQGGTRSLLAVWVRALTDSLRNGLAERSGWGDRNRSRRATQFGRRLRPGAIVRSSGNWAATRRS